MTVNDLPALNACLNGISTLLLLTGFVFIRQKRMTAHRNCMISAFTVSCIFLITYVAHKILVKGVHTPFGGEGAIRTIYYVMLFSHIVLAMVIVPLVLMTLSRALKARYEFHKQIARWTWPIWMYVSVTGVLVYLFLYHFYPHAPMEATATGPGNGDNLPTLQVTHGGAGAAAAR